MESNDPKHINNLVKKASIDERGALDDFREVQGILEQRQEIYNDLLEQEKVQEEHIETLLTEEKEKVSLLGSAVALKKWRAECSSAQEHLKKIRMSLQEAHEDVERAESVLDKKREVLQGIQKKRAKFQEVGDKRDILRTSVATAREEELSYDRASGRRKK